MVAVICSSEPVLLVSWQLTRPAPWGSWAVSVMSGWLNAWPVTVMTWVTWVVAWVSRAVSQPVASGCGAMVRQFVSVALPADTLRGPSVACGSMVTDRVAWVSDTALPAGLTVTPLLAPSVAVTVNDAGVSGCAPGSDGLKLSPV